MFYCRVRFIFRYFLFHLMNKMGYIDQVARFLEAVTQDAYYKSAYVFWHLPAY